MCEQVITGARTEPLDLKKLQEMPGIVGYIVQPGDSLWKIAKKISHYCGSCDGGQRPGAGGGPSRGAAGTGEGDFPVRRRHQAG